MHQEKKTVLEVACLYQEGHEEVRDERRGLEDVSLR